MYSACGVPWKSHVVFDQLEWKNLYQWNALLSGYSKNEFYHDALCVFIELISLTDYKPDNYTFPCVIKACGGFLDVGLGRAVHGMVVKMGLADEVFVANALVIMYGKFGMVEKSKDIFECIPERNLVSWNSMLSVLVDIGDYQGCFCLFTQLLQMEDFVPDSATFVTVLPLCAREGLATVGRAIHGLAMKVGISGELSVRNSLIDMYSKCRMLAQAWDLFDVNANKNVVTWNSIIGGYAREGDVNRTCGLLRKMQKAQDGLKADQVTVLNVLSVFSDASELMCVKELHGYSLRRRFGKDELLMNAFISAYARCVSLISAECVFYELESKTMSSWNALIGGLLNNGEALKAIEIYLEMRTSGMYPDSVSITSLLLACTQLKLPNHGMQIHGYVLRNGLETDLFISASLLSFYFSCGFPLLAQILFNNLENRSLVTWNAMIAGYSQSRLPSKALKVFHQLVSEGIQPDEIALVSVLGACSQLSSLSLGKEAHCFVLKHQLMDSFLICSVIDMYAKSGSLELSQKVFNQLSDKDSASCTVMISGLAIHGYGEEANNLYLTMQKNGLKPDRFTYAGILMACKHAGLVEEGLKYFGQMRSLHSIEPELEHYACVVDMLGRAGRFADALDLVAKMPLQPDAGVWSSLLNSSMIHKEFNFGRIFAEKLLKLSPQKSETYVLVSNFFAGYGMWDHVRTLRRNMKELGLEKDVGCSWIEIEGKSSSFTASDRIHPESKLIWSMWRRLEEKISKMGYSPDIGSVLHELKEEEKLEILRGHSEKLALSFALLKTAKDTSVRIFKNLRICQDCHNAIKLVSKVTCREIIVRDNKLFHHFKEGFCSCGDYW